MQKLNEYTTRTEAALEAYLAPPWCAPVGRIVEAMRYSLLAGGKRLRPALTMEFCRVCGGDPAEALPFACALEMVHTYSLIHDDLPCMDDDDLRRGKPSSHKVFGEALAVLAGDALLTLAFRVALDGAASGKTPLEQVIAATSALADACGVKGMVGGQVLDLEGETRAFTEDELREMQNLKTGALLRGAAQMGCLVAGASQTQQTAAVRYAHKLGLAFQIRDDILDLEGDAAILGKNTGSDAASGKSTFVSLLGVEQCKRRVEDLTQEAIAAVQVFDDTAFLTELARSLVSRSY